MDTKLVYIYLNTNEYANLEEHGKVSIKMISDQIGISEKTIEHCLHELKELNLIK